MPLYEYECDNCGNNFEKIQSVHDAPLVQCPNCSANSLRKVFHPAGIIFKGSGWYITDSRNSSSASTGTANSKSETKSEPKAETKSENKSETKSESKPNSDAK